MSHGLNLTEADTLIFYAPIYSNDEFQQVSDRFNRAGQTLKMTIVRMAAHPRVGDLQAARQPQVDAVQHPRPLQSGDGMKLLKDGLVGVIGNE
jgi:hypothetical protein